MVDGPNAFIYHEGDEPESRQLTPEEQLLKNDAIRAALAAEPSPADLKKAQRLTKGLRETLTHVQDANGNIREIEWVDPIPPSKGDA